MQFDEIWLPLPTHCWSPVPELAYEIVGIQCTCAARLPNTLLPVNNCDAPPFDPAICRLFHTALPASRLFRGMS